MSKVVNNYVKVFYRIFPSENPCWDLLKVKDKSKVYLRNVQQLSDPRKSKQPPIFWEFETDGIFFNSRQELVYSEVAGDILERVSKGYNGIIVAFGQTGSGKSLTVAGLQLAEENFGIVPRAINELFALKKTLPRNVRMCIQMSYAEFSKSAVVDLLKEFPNNVDAWHAKETVTKMKVKCEFDALKLLYLGEGRKSSVQTGNYMSHYNTSVVTFHVTTMDIDFSNPRQISSRLHIVDMAGVDIISDESCIYKDPLDVGYANMNKLNLGLFLTCLMTKNPELIRIKQRTNPLMYYLGSDLSNKSFARFVGHIKISRENLPITMSMLKFGQVMKGYKPTQKELQFDLDPEYKIQYLQNQLDKLQLEKIANSVLLNQDLTTNLNVDRMDHLQRTVNDYLKGGISDINLMNVADISVVFKLFRDMCNQLELERNRLARERLHESEMSVTKKAASKTSTSMSSLRERKGSVLRRITKKLKESSSVIGSMQGVEKVEKVDKSTSIPSLNDPKSKNYVGKTDRSSGSISNLYRKKTSRIGKGSIANMRRSASISKRKSIASVSAAENKFLVSDVLLLPNDIPENREAWKLYIGETSYKNLVEEYKANEAYIMATYSNYMGDIEKLQDTKNTVENMKHDITEANVMRKFNVCTKEGENKFTESILSEAELICKENLAYAQRDLLEQQETVLRSQAELKIYLNIRKDLKKQLNTDFENYCKDKFNVTVPNMKNLSEEEMVNDTKYSTVNSDEKNLDEERKTVTIMPRLSSLKKLMKKEHIKTDKRRSLSRITWTNLPSTKSSFLVK